MSVNRTKPQSKQQGVILIVALFVVALVTVVVTSVSWKYTLNMTRYKFRWHGAVAESYLEGAEEFAKKVLIDDAANGMTFDSLGEDWALAGVQEFSTDDGVIRMQLRDAQSYFNLNALLEKRVPTEQETKDKNFNPSAWKNRFTPAQLHFIRMLQGVMIEGQPMEEAQALELTEAIIDWIDPDSNPTGFGGVEASFYEGLDPPVHIPNSPMFSKSELLLVKGMTPEIYQQIQPYVVALDPAAKLNLNTMSPILMAGLNGNTQLTLLTNDVVAEMVRLRREYMNLDDAIEAMNNPNITKPNSPAFEDVAEFQSEILFESLGGVANKEEYDLSHLDTKSSFFILKSEVLLGDSNDGDAKTGYSLLQRVSQNKVLVISRSSTGF